MKQGEIDYVKTAGPKAAAELKGKPFSVPKRGLLLQDIGRMIWHLEPYRGRLLDMGCGSGWTSIFLAKAGFEVVGVDISPDMIHLAKSALADYPGTQVDFRVADYEALSYEAEFNAVVFYDSLHHAEDELLCLEKAYAALRPGGLCICYEPGEGHAESTKSKEAVQRFGVNEKDMPPRRIMELGEQVGFEVRQLVGYKYAGKALRPRRSALKRYCHKIERCWKILSTSDPFRDESRERNIVLLKKGSADS